MDAATSTAQARLNANASFIPQANQWVTLRDTMPGYGYHQALLLCEANDEHWVAWIPDHGEALLTREQMLHLPY